MDVWFHWIGKVARDDELAVVLDFGTTSKGNSDGMRRDSILTKACVECPILEQPKCSHTRSASAIEQQGSSIEFFSPVGRERTGRNRNRAIVSEAGVRLPVW